MSGELLLHALPLAEHGVGIPLLLSLVAQRNLVLYVSHPDDTLVNSFGLHCQRVRIRSSTSRKDFIRALFPAPPSQLARARSRTARKRSLPTSPAATTPRLGPKRQPSDASSFPFNAQDDGYDSTSTAYQGGGGPQSPRSPLARPDWERGISTHYDAPPTSPLSSASQLQLQIALDTAWTPRLPNAVVISGLENAGTAVQHTLSEILRTRTVVLDDDAGSPGPGAGGGRIESLPDPFIVVYVCARDPFERPHISKGLLDRFGCSSIVTKPSTGLGSPSTYRSPAQRKVAITRDDILDLRHLAAQVHMHHPLTLQLSAFLSATRHHPRLDGTLLTLQANRDFTDLVRAWRVVMGPSNHALADVDSLDATENDAVRVFSHAVMHRVRVRAGPHDEIMGSYAFGALAQAGEGDEEPFPESDPRARPEIVQVLKEIVNVV
ncbi:hypothetical protein EXIGLDRAFT_761807 [Exidia glandulosa HHB12029]|uniref:Uncharacterized protein n=1 Tax=Exidia glandulosa HHB12029 TaxID=1314781 RepID=A0A165N4C5_EXIGL|nr:hypothetical protein EXIGLDRAFT_761807 [Exidia glandulosa HHB12029]